MRLASGDAGRVFIGFVTSNSRQPVSQNAGDLRIRLLDDATSTGPVNMARDEALLIMVGEGELPPTLRLYEWSEPTVSLGYFQHHRDYQSLPPPAGDMPVVRRQTGGGAILHDRELTYSVVLPTCHSIARGKPNALYELVHDALIACLAEQDVAAHRDGSDDGSGAAKGPFFCFARRHRFDVLIGTDKLAGSAQRRTRNAILQHGSIILRRRFEQQPSAELEPLGIDGRTLRARLVSALAERLAVDIVAGARSDDESKRAEALMPKYAGAEWSQRK